MHFIVSIITLVSILSYPFVASAANYNGTVDRVIDGDTVVIGGTTIRLIGIDTPETHHPSKPIQCFGSEATEYARTMLEGKSVRYVTDEKYQTQDKYDRLLAYIYVDNKFYNAETVKNGYAFAYTRFPFKFSKEFVQLEEKAKKQKKGLWNNCSISCDKKTCTTNAVQISE